MSLVAFTEGRRRQVRRAALVAILVVAAYTRLSHPELSWFSVDQARDARAALGIVSDAPFRSWGWKPRASPSTPGVPRISI